MAPDPEPMSLAERLNHLFKITLNSNGKPYHNEYVAAWIRKRDIRVTGQYLRNMREGKAANPGVQVVAALAEFFNVPVEYLAAPVPPALRDDQQRQQLLMLAELREAGVAHLAYAALGLQRPAVETIERMIAWARRAEGLPELAPGAFTEPGRHPDE